MIFVTYINYNILLSFNILDLKIVLLHQFYISLIG